MQIVKTGPCGILRCVVNKGTHLPAMVPSCGAGCRLLVTWLLAGYRVTECLVTGLSFDSSPISLNPMRPVVFVSNPTHPARNPTIHLTVTPYFIVTKTNKTGRPDTQSTVFIDFGGSGCPGSSKSRKTVYRARQAPSTPFSLISGVRAAGEGFVFST